MKLFLCNTPLQTLIAERIIEAENIPLHKCAMLYVCDNISEKAHKCFISLSSAVKFSEFIYFGRTLKTILLLRKFISKLGSIDEIYLACIDDSLAHYAISFSGAKSIKTFDDGTANIVPSSTYFKGVDKGIIRGVILNAFHWINGNRYSLEKIKAESTTHYSIYDKFQNVMNNVKYIHVFDAANDRREMCCLFNGVDYSQYCKSKADAILLRGKVRHLLACLPGDVIYIPGEKSDYKFFSDFVVDRHILNEELVNSLIKRYKTTRLYGFADSLQNLFMSIDGIVVQPVKSTHLLSKVNRCTDVLSRRCNTEAIIL